MNEICAIVVNWLTARRTLGAVKNIRSYYPNLFIYIIDDGSNENDRGEFFRVYRDPGYRADVVYDPDNEKLKNISGTEYIQVPTHRRHGESMDYAMDFIDSKWIFHIDSDARIKRAGVIEYMLDGTDDNYCGVGIQKIQHPDYPKVFNIIFAFRQDLLKKYGLKLKPIYKLGLESSTRYFKFLTDRGYKIKYLSGDVNGDMRNYFTHLRYVGGRKDEWNKYF